MNARLEADTVRSAETAVAEASKVVLAAQEDVTRFRNAQVVVDPSQNAVAQLATITDLSSQVDQVLAQIAENNRLSPSSPMIAGLKAKADALSAQIATEQKALAGSGEAVAGQGVELRAPDTAEELGRRQSRGRKDCARQRPLGRATPARLH